MIIPCILVINAYTNQYLYRSTDYRNKNEPRNQIDFTIDFTEIADFSPENPTKIPIIRNEINTLEQ